MLYNNINPFKRVFPYYLMFGFVLLFILLVNIFRQKHLPNYLRITFYGLIILLFLVHTAGLIIRWYISGHAPWINGYESVVYVAWAVMLAGLIFGRKIPMVDGAAAFSGVKISLASHSVGHNHRKLWFYRIKLFPGHSCTDINSNAKQ